jgi:hypothetical protein
MQDNLTIDINLDERLAKKICHDFLSNVTLIKKDDIIFELKQVLKQYSITDIDFLDLIHLIKYLCILKQINYQTDYVYSGLAELFEGDMIFRKTIESLFTTITNKESVHLTILKTFDTICKNITTKEKIFEYRSEKLKVAGYCYYIKKNKKDAYICSCPVLYEEEIFISRLHSLEYDLTKLPDAIKSGRSLIVKHPYKCKRPYFNGFFLTEIEKAINLIEKYGIE